jgi:phospholipid/cholesterol/gamma-HCH transport system substrate-binding protein
MNPSQSWFKVRRRLVGVVFLVILGFLGWLSLALYNKQFTPVTMVTLYTDSTGNEMHVHADVMVRGVPVGEVRQITADGDGARLELAIQPDQARKLPANVFAEMLPTTLFGQRYVDLIMPASPATQTLASVRVIRQDRSQDAIELEKVLANLLPMLTAVQPQKLAVTLTAISQALQGRGPELGQTLDQINSLLRQINPQLPTIDTDINELVQVTKTYNQAAPSIVGALNDFSVTSRTIASEASSLLTLYATVTGAARSLNTFLDQNKGNIIMLSADSTSTLRILDRYSAEFPCVLQDLASFEPNMDKVLGKGTSQPGLHVNVDVVPSLGKYVAGQDTPKYGDNIGPHCYPIPFSGIKLNDGASPAGGTATRAPGPATNSVTVAQGGLGLPNSPQENELINELLAPALRVTPHSLPDWSSVLLGPLYRGTEVELK